MEPVNYLKEMLGVGEGTIVDTAVDIVLGEAPIIGKVIRLIK